jgi:NitT/TauT family transport system ATP-binding protein
MESASDLLVLDHVVKSYANGLQAVAEASFALRREEFVSLIGPSGCGKSTLLRLVAGLGAPSGGRIDWPGLDPTKKMRARNIGFVFQEPTLMPWANVAANIALPLRLERRGRGEVAAAVARAVELVGLQGFERAFPRELSGGMKMRAAIARALVTEPPVLLMDEPFAALDEIARTRLNDELLALCARARLSVLFVTHSIYEAVYLSGRILVMTPRPGRIAAEIPVPAPYPRGESFRASTFYHAYCARVSEALRGAMALAS